MKTATIIMFAIVVTGCASKHVGEGDWKTWSLRRHLDICWVVSEKGGKRTHINH